MNENIALGVIIGNRDFFLDRLISEGRSELLAVLEAENINAIILDEQTTQSGAVETWEDAKKCAALFKQHARRHRRGYRPSAQLRR